MSLHEKLTQICSVTPETFTAFRDRLDDGWIQRALAAKGVATLRRRRLPAEVVVWLVIGMALMRDRRIEEVVSKLDLALPVASGKTIAPSSIPQARQRLGEDVMKWLFEETGLVWAAEGADTRKWRGLSIYGTDGTDLRVPDSPENRKEFGGQKCSADKGESGYPMVRLLVLMALRTHVMAGAIMGGYEKTSEQAMFRELVDKIPDDSLTVLDRNFLSPLSLLPLQRGGKGRHWLTRLKSNTKYEVKQELGKGDAIVTLKVSAEARKKDPTLPKLWTGRAIQYQRKGFKIQTLLTSLLDAEQYPAGELIEMYHERWEIELGNDEIKTDMLQRQEAIRSKKPESVRQEIWGVLIAYNLVRLEMARVATQTGVAPNRISFTLAMALIVDEWLWSTVSVAPGVIPKHLVRLRQNLQRLVLPVRRGDRAYPRAVKVKMSNYKRKRPTPAVVKGEATTNGADATASEG